MIFAIVIRIYEQKKKPNLGLFLKEFKDFVK